MPVTKSKSRLTAEAFYAQAQQATDRAMQQGYGGIGGFLLGASPQERLQIDRAAEAEQYALGRRRQADERMEALPQMVSGADALARSAGARPQDLTPEQRAAYGYNIAQQAQAGIDPNTTAAMMAGNAQLNPAIRQQLEAEQQTALMQQDKLNLEAQLKQQQIKKEFYKTQQASVDAQKAARDFANYDPEAVALEREAAKGANLRTLQEQAAQEAGIPIPGKGQAQVTDPLTGQPKIANLPGTPEYDAAFSTMREQLSALRLANQIVSDINQSGVSGTEYVGTRAARIRQSRSQLMSTIFKARGLGAPQGPDIELVERGLVDPTSLMNNLQGLSGMGKASILQGYQGVQEEMQNLLTNQLLSNPFLIDGMTKGDVAQLEPSSDLFQTIVKLRPDLMPR